MKMKVTILVSLIAGALFLLFQSNVPLKHLRTKLLPLTESSDMSQSNEKAGPTLHLKSEILVNLSLHIDDVELLQNAFLAQALVGPLIRFSNRGRYEPYVAKKWTQSGNDWTFFIHDGLTCEDGQEINAESYRLNLLRSVNRLSPQDLEQTPFRDLSGITAQQDTLTLKFKKPTGKALLEYLAMTPFAFLCDSNFDGTKKWKSRTQFVSSGPYRVAEFNPESNLSRLELRKDWPLNPPHAFKTVLLTKDDFSDETFTSKLHMTYSHARVTGPRDGIALEVPRALVAARLGINEGQFFADRRRRQELQLAINKVMENVDIGFENYHRADSFFFGQISGHEIPNQLTGDRSEPPARPLKVRGIPTGTRPEVDFYQGILFEALKQLGWTFEMIERPIKSIKDFHTITYDISFDRSHVDATLDPDFVRLLFKSHLGPKYQDPGNRISKLVDTFDSGKLTYRDFLINFNSIISEEAAILPLFHRGFTWKFTPNVDVRSISPLMSILRYEELKLKDYDTSSER